MADERASKARRRALRAAQGVTISFALAGGACGGERPSGGTDGGGDATVAMDSGGSGDAGGTDAGGGMDAGGTDAGGGMDAGGGTDAGEGMDAAMMADAGHDGGRDAGAADAGECDAGPMAGGEGDCICPSTESPGTDADCCVLAGGFWSSGGCAVPGPFVPPSMTA